MACNSKSGALESGMIIFTGATSGGRKPTSPKKNFFFNCCLFTTARWYRRVLIGVSPTEFNAASCSTGLSCSRYPCYTLRGSALLQQPEIREWEYTELWGEN